MYYCRFILHLAMKTAYTFLVFGHIWFECQQVTVIGSRWRYGYFLATGAWLTGSLLVTSRKPHLLLNISLCRM